MGIDEPRKQQSLCPQQLGLGQEHCHLHRAAGGTERQRFAQGCSARTPRSCSRPLSRSRDTFPCPSPEVPGCPQSPRAVALLAQRPQGHPGCTSPAEIRGCSLHFTRLLASVFLPTHPCQLLHCVASSAFQHVSLSQRGLNAAIPAGGAAGTPQHPRACVCGEGGPFRHAKAQVVARELAEAGCVEAPFHQQVLDPNRCLFECALSAFHLLSRADRPARLLGGLAPGHAAKPLFS